MWKLFIHILWTSDMSRSDTKEFFMGTRVVSDQCSTTNKSTIYTGAEKNVIFLSRVD